LQRFHGLTVYARDSADGFWREDGKRTVHDDVVVFEVMIDDVDKSLFKICSERGKAEARGGGVQMSTLSTGASALPRAVRFRTGSKKWWRDYRRLLEKKFSQETLIVRAQEIFLL